ncbi:hypothetical protein RRG08_059558 [Elysia crispata]|uniref:Uncharacterized protein n=1 Tax=Elysia crispata TaxID=231223 RepID=A0AAE1ALP0_9GAST|nr:hypothetical protein RRG08_059558 [Elysia crispata]
MARENHTSLEVIPYGLKRRSGPPAGFTVDIESARWLVAPASRVRLRWEFESWHSLWLSFDQEVIMSRLAKWIFSGETI